MNYNYVYSCVKEFKNKILKSDEECKNLIEIFKRKKDFLILEFPNKMSISGMTLEKKDRDICYKCIYINTNEPIGRRNFSFAHELYHVYYEKSKKNYSDYECRNDEVEQRAELFASNLLIPRLELLYYLKKYGCKNYKEITMEKIFDLQMKFNASFQAIIYSIESLNGDERYLKYKSYIPQIPAQYKRYYKSDWDELAKRTIEYDKNNNLNSVKSEFIFPKRFKELLIKNYKDKKIAYDDVESIFNFFNETFKEN